MDADDLWEKEKLEKELLFAERNRAGFVFTGYEFADENGKGTGKIVRVPEHMNYHQALKNTTIFTSTVLFDTAVIAKELLEIGAASQAEVDQAEIAALAIQIESLEKQIENARANAEDNFLACNALQ